MAILEQWLAGRDFARGEAAAAQMVNFVYLLADEESGDAWLVDPAWDVRGLVERVKERGYRLRGALLTHWHPDHAGGDLFGLAVEGAARLHRDFGVAVHAHQDEAPWLERSAGLSAADLTPFASGAVLSLGSVRVRCVHTPGHTPGSTCYLVRDARAAESGPGSLLTGDTLFVGSCGRIDLPGSDPAEMYRTLHDRLAALPAETLLYPGHDYGPRPVSTLGEERRTNPYLQVPTLESWLAEMG